MKWIFLKGRSGLQKRRTQASPVLGADFDLSNLDGGKDIPEAEQIANKVPIDQVEGMNVDDKAAPISSANPTDPGFNKSEDATLRLISSPKANLGVQPPHSVETDAYICTVQPENPKAAKIVHAVDALERVQTYVEQCSASLRYFVDLGSGNQSRDFADVKRHLTSTHSLMNSSASILLTLREVAAALRELASKEVPIPNEQHEPRGEMLLSELEAPLEEPSPNTTSQRVDLGAIQSEQVGPQRVDRVLPVIEIPLEEPGPSATSEAGDLCPRPSEQGESKRFEEIQTLIDEPGPSTASEPVDMPEQQHGFLQEAKNPLEEPSPNTRSQQIDFIAIENEQVEPQQIDRPLPEIEIPLEESSPSAMSQPGDLGPIPSEPDEPKRLEAIQNPIDKPTPSTASEPVVTLEQQHEVLWEALEEPSPNTTSLPIDLGAIQNEQVEPQRIDRAVPAIEIPLEESSPSATSQPGDLGPTPSEPDEPKWFEAIQIPIDTPRPSTANEPVDTARHQHEVLGEAKIPLEEPSATSQPGDPGLTLSEQDEPKRFETIQIPIDMPSPSSMSVQRHELLWKAKIPLERPGPSTASQPGDLGPTPSEPDEPKRFEAIQIPIDTPSPSTASEPVDTPEQQHEVLRNAKIPLEEPGPSATSQPGDLGLTRSESDEPKRFEEMRIPIDNPSPSTASEPVDTPEQQHEVVWEAKFPLEEPQDERKRVEDIEVHVEKPRPNTASIPVDTGPIPKEPEVVDSIPSEVEIPLEEPGPSATSEAGDLGPTPSEQGEPKQFEEIQVPIDNPSPSTASEPVDTPEQQHEILWEALEQPSRSITSQPADPGPTTNEHMVVSEAEIPLDRLNQNTARPADPGPPPNQPEDLIVPTLDVPVDKPSTDSQPMLQVGPLEIQTQQDEQKRVDMVLSEIRCILAESPPIQKTRIEQRDAAAVVVSEIGDDKAVSPLNADRAEDKPSELKASDAAFAQEVEALLGISTSSESSTFLNAPGAAMISSEIRTGKKPIF